MFFADIRNRHRRKRVRALRMAARQKFSEAAYKDALPFVQQALAITPDCPNLRYDLACIHARQGALDEAVTELSQAAHCGYHNWCHAERDTDLDSIREHPGYAEAIILLKRNADRYGDRGLEVLGVALEFRRRMPARKLREWCEQQNITWPQIHGGRGWKSRLAKKFHVRRIPNAFFVDREGRVAECGPASIAECWVRRELGLDPENPKRD